MSLFLKKYPCPTETNYALVLGGQDPNASEIIDLTTAKALAVPQITSLPIAMSGLVANVVHGTIMACGGLRVKTCYTYDFNNDFWRNFRGGLNGFETRYLAANFVSNDGDWYILGGRDDFPAPKKYFDTAVKFNGTEFSSAGAMPFATCGACAVNVNATHVFLAGGRNESVNGLTMAYLLEVESWTWTRLPDMAVGRYNICRLNPMQN